MTKRILVTGGTGRLGRVLVRQLLCGIRQEFPSELLQSTLGDIKGGSSAVQKKGWKLLNDNRFKK
ncbi:hypothetical protein ACWCPQ_23010 [Nocardia sp. NPDC001965]